MFALKESIYESQEYEYGKKNNSGERNGNRKHRHRPVKREKERQRERDRENKNDRKKQLNGKKKNYKNRFNRKTTTVVGTLHLHRAYTHYLPYAQPKHVTKQQQRKKKYSNEHTNSKKK